MIGILRALNPAEFYIWTWLYCRSVAVISNQVIVRRNAKSFDLIFYTGRHLRNILHSLQAKGFLDILSIPKNQFQDLVVELNSLRCSEMEFRPRWAPGNESPGEPSMEVKRPLGRSLVSDHLQREKPELMRACGLAGKSVSGQPCSASASARKENLEAFVEEKDQRRLLVMIDQAAITDRELLERELVRLAPWPNGKKVSKTAKIYAMVRFLQDGASVNHPAAWVQAVAMKGERLLQQILYRHPASVPAAALAAGAGGGKHEPKI